MVHRYSISLWALAVATATPAFAEAPKGPDVAVSGATEAGAPQASGAQAKSAKPDATQAEPQEDAKNEVIVIGTRRTDRTVTTSASPIDVISASDLRV